MRKEFLPFGTPLLEQEEIDDVVDSLKSGWIGTGPKVRAFEEKFKAYKGVKHAVALNSGTSALHLALKVLGIKAADEVIVPSMTFVSSANVVLHCGATPVLADCYRDTMNIDPQAFEKKITPTTKAVIVVHMAGRPCEMDEIMKIAKAHDLFVVEDAAHAVESEYKGKKIGAIGDIGCFSFYPTKNVPTAEGGMFITNNDDWAAKARVLSLHGMSADAWKRYGSEGYKHYEVVEPGFKYNMTDVQAAIALRQFERVEKNWLRRKEIWDRYSKELKGIPITLPAPFDSQSRHALHLYTIFIDQNESAISRDQFLQEMTKRNIGTGVHFRAVHQHVYYKEQLGISSKGLENSERIGNSTVSLPLSVKLSDTDVTDVIQAIKDIFAAKHG